MCKNDVRSCKAVDADKLQLNNHKFRVLKRKAAQIGAEKSLDSSISGQEINLDVNREAQISQDLESQISIFYSNLNGLSGGLYTHQNIKTVDTMLSTSDFLAFTEIGIEENEFCNKWARKFDNTQFTAANAGPAFEQQINEGGVGTNFDLKTEDVPVSVFLPIVIVQ